MEGDLTRHSKRCSHCRVEKPVEVFAWRARAEGRRAPNCRACQAEYNRAHYQANRSEYLARAEASNLRYRLERTKRLLAYLATHPCVDCGESDPVVLEFDHLREKQFDIGTELSYRRWTTILVEIDKCEVVCCNCHRRRTSTRSGARRVVLGRAADAAERTS